MIWIGLEAVLFFFGFYLEFQYVLHMFQQNRYEIHRFYHWMSDQRKEIQEEVWFPFGVAIIGVFWAFGDGYESFSKSVSYHYQTVGIYRQS